MIWRQCSIEIREEISKKCRISSQKNCKTSCSIVLKVPHNCIYLNACINGSFLLTWFLEFCLPEKNLSLLRFFPHKTTFEIGTHKILREKSPLIPTKMLIFLPKKYIFSKHMRILSQCILVFYFVCLTEGQWIFMEMAANTFCKTFPCCCGE